MLLYGGRSPDQLLYTDELEQWAARGLDVAVTVDSAGPEWLGHVGVVPRLIGRAEFDPAGAAALVVRARGDDALHRRRAGAAPASPATRVYASMERNMQCGIGHCGHCQLGPTLICRDGPVYRWSELERRGSAIREL